MKLTWMLPALISVLLAGCDAATGTAGTPAPWAPSWTRIGPAPDAGTASLDSLGGMLAALSSGSVASAPDVWWRTGDSTWTKRTLPVASSPVFWNGKVWWTESDTAGSVTFTTGYNSKYGNSYASYPLLSRVIVRSFDGLVVDSTELLVQADSMSRIDLVPDGASLSLIGIRAQQRSDVWADRTVYLVADNGWVNRGIGWVQDDSKTGAWWYRMIHVPGGAAVGWIRRVDGASRPGLVWDGVPLVLPALTAPAALDAGTFATVRNSAIAEYSWLAVPRMGIAGYGNSFFALTQGTVWRIPVTGEANVQVASPSSNLVLLQVWRGKLLVSDGVSLWSTSLEGTP